MERAKLLVLTVLGASLSVFAACRQPQADGRRRTEADPRTRVDAILAAHSCSDLACTAPARCEMQSDMPRCVCPAGYTGDGQNCQDVDECAAGAASACGAHALCVNRVGGFDCTCEPGYEGDGHDCSLAAASCTSGDDSCGADASCVTDAAGSRCVCLPGFTGDGRTCRDIDECQTGQAQCAEHARCENRRGSFTCTCDVPFEGDGTMSCRDTCEANARAAGRCDPAGNGRCVFSADGQASCTSCLPGFVGDGASCTADAECQQLACGANSVCAGATGARRCECASGFAGDPMMGCTDIDECTDAGRCPDASSRCVNTPGGYVCTCADGFQSVNGVCTNIDECATHTDLCDAAADCTDTSPGYDCTCKKGYEGDGRTCTDIDECAGNANACATGMGTVCRNTMGSYECICPPGYIGDGVTAACACDLSGYWGTRIDTVTKLDEISAGDVVLVAAMQTQTSVWELSRFEYDGTEIKISVKNCGESEDPEIYSPLYDEVYSLGTPAATFDHVDMAPGPTVPMPRTAALPGMPYVTPREAVMQGIKLNDPLNAPWPMASTDVPSDAWVDSEHDGEPGLSVWPASTEQQTRRGTDETYSYMPVGLKVGTSLVGARVGCVSSGIRAIRSFKGTIDTCGQLSGQLNIEKFEARVQGCTVVDMSMWDKGTVTCTAQDWATAQRCTADQVQFVDEQALPYQTGGPFEMLKLAGLDATDVDCAKVRAALPALPQK